MLNLTISSGSHPVSFHGNQLEFVEQKGADRNFGVTVYLNSGRQLSVEESFDGIKSVLSDGDLNLLNLTNLATSQPTLINSSEIECIEKEDLNANNGVSIFLKSGRKVFVSQSYELVVSQFTSNGHNTTTLNVLPSGEPILIQASEVECIEQKGAQNDHCVVLFLKSGKKIAVSESYETVTASLAEQIVRSPDYVTDQKLIFHHIAKTAGTSLIKQFRDQRNSCDTARYDPELTEEVILDKQWDFYHGHFSLEKLISFRQILGSEAFSFTFLRHPVERALSQYYNWTDQKRVLSELENIRKRQAMNVEDKQALFENHIFKMSLSDFLQSNNEEVRQVVENHLLRYLSKNLTYQNSPAQALLEAKSNITGHFNFFGFQEAYNSSVEILASILNNNSLVSDKKVRENTNDSVRKNGRYTLTQKQYDMLVEKNSESIALFNFAAGVFIGRYRDLLTSDDVINLTSGPSVTIEA